MTDVGHDSRPPLAVGDFVLNLSERVEPWGHPKGRILMVNGNPGFALVQDLRPYGGREWWPVASLAVLPPDPFPEPWPPHDNDCGGNDLAPSDVAFLGPEPADTPRRRS